MLISVNTLYRKIPLPVLRSNVVFSFTKILSLLTFNINLTNDINPLINVRYRINIVKTAETTVTQKNSQSMEPPEKLDSKILRKNFALPVISQLSLKNSITISASIVMHKKFSFFFIIVFIFKVIVLNGQFLFLFHFDSYGKYLGYDQAEHAKHKSISPCANPFITFNDII